MALSGNNSSGYKEAVLHKWGERLLDEGFVPFPKRLIRCASRVFTGDLRMSELCVVLAIIDYQRPQLSRRPSLMHLAKVAGFSEDRFRKCLKRLKKRNLLSWTGTEDAMDFDYSNLKRLVIGLTDK